MPACAGMTEEWAKRLPHPSFPRRRESRLAGGAALSRNLRLWIPAFAGMTACVGQAERTA
ncbi:MAG: hypothetical protein EKK50_10660 [Sphingomonadaceae bacterium]|nr:MAG: hypothetical protein EKK50_10660 [Sphingomonadaceae bacterium]